MCILSIISTLHIKLLDPITLRRQSGFYSMHDLDYHNGLQGRHAGSGKDAVLNPLRHNSVVWIVAYTSPRKVSSFSAGLAHHGFVVSSSHVFRRIRVLAVS